MATTTSNLGLTKPIGTEQYDINVFNNNADTIDAVFGASEGHAHTGVAGDGPPIPTGGIADGAITAQKMAATAFLDTQFQNLLRNGDFESWSAGTSSAPDGWTLYGAGASVARSTAHKRGSYSACLTRSGADCSTYYQALGNAGGQDYIRSRTFTFGAWVYATVANRARLKATDGAGTYNSAYHTGGGAWEWLTLTVTADAAATALSCQFVVVTGDTSANIDGAILVEGGSCPAFCLHPNDEHLRISNHQTSAPANQADQGVWRAEMGQVSIAGNTGASSVSKAIAFETAFRTVRRVLISRDGNHVGNKRTIFGAGSLATSGFTAYAHTADAANFADTSPGTASWLAIGQV